MITIRLSRTGKSHAPQYRVVVQEKGQDPWAPAKEIVGTYNPRTNPSTINLKEDRIKHWLEHGAQPSTTVHNLLIEAGIIKADKKNPVHLSNKRKGKMEEKKAAEEEKKKEAEAKAAEEKAAAEEAAQAEAEAPAEEAPADDATAETPAEETKEEAATEEATEEKKEDAPAEDAPAEEKQEEKSE